MLAVELADITRVPTSSSLIAFSMPGLRRYHRAGAVGQFAIPTAEEGVAR